MRGSALGLLWLALLALGCRPSVPERVAGEGRLQLARDSVEAVELGLRAVAELEAAEAVRGELPPKRVAGFEALNCGFVLSFVSDIPPGQAGVGGGWKVFVPRRPGACVIEVEM